MRTVTQVDILAAVGEKSEPGEPANGSPTEGDDEGEGETISQEVNLQAKSCQRRMSASDVEESLHRATELSDGGPALA